jgi:hypothetical protein
VTAAVAALTTPPIPCCHPFPHIIVQSASAEGLCHE